jgi:hypothetical protein
MDTKNLPVGVLETVQRFTIPHPEMSLHSARRLIRIMNSLQGLLQFSIQQVTSLSLPILTTLSEFGWGYLSAAAPQLESETCYKS